jgi:hypothetical protein
MTKIRLLDEVRWFEKAFPQGVVLCNTGRILKRGTVVEVGELATMSFDHDDKVVIYARINGADGFLLHKEVETSLDSECPPDFLNPPVTKITRYRLNLNPPADIFGIEIESPQGTWKESFGSENDLRIFLRGVTAALGLYGIYISSPEIPMNAEYVISVTS